jgi:hypothetical protein
MDSFVCGHQAVVRQLLQDLGEKFHRDVEALGDRAGADE